MAAALRAGLLGLGMMGRHHARVLRSLAGVELVAVADPGGDPHGVAAGLPVGDSVQALVDAGVDYAVVAAPTQFHEDVALALADAGVHALIEKPLAPSTDAAVRIVDAFAGAGLVGAVGHIERYNPALQSLRRRIESGDLGDVYQVATRRQGPFPARIADVGVVKDLATHDIDLTAWITQAAFTGVTAHVAHKSGRSHEDLVAFVGTLDSGVLTNHLVNWLSPFKERTTVVSGERGTFVADTVTADLTYYANGIVETTWESLAGFRGVSEGDVVRFALGKREPLLVEHEAFRDAVLGVGSDVVSLVEGARTVRVAEAVLESARAGQTVRV
ncbi:dehydrogenase [Cellulomonas chitinilytica]|uniref:Dehydrogenase n=1 Tax=Cellulomonas chitinilytica TaxID=398759 RepID=A0A919TYW3_9CELL|nr:Gfo/Idh/MocA family oxidoreductase [Cellulomonas chitinilytica]GIG20168.1 dehydrogenase [Cellulomonas chitinilytica]